MKEFYDFMRFPIKGSNDYWQVIRAGYRKYDVYLFTIDVYPDGVIIYYYPMDLNEYTEEELAEYVSAWGYKSLAAFADYLENKTPVKNHELRLCTCIIENNPFLEPEIAFEGNLEDASEFIAKVTPEDDSENEDKDDPENYDRLRC